MFKKAALIAVTGAILAGCGTTTSTTTVKAIPSSHVDELYAAGFAMAIADNCPSLRYNEAYEDRTTTKMATQLVAAGYTPYELEVGLARASTDREMAIRILRFVNERAINTESEASWCRAGRAERAKRTQIGRYLI